MTAAADKAAEHSRARAGRGGRARTAQPYPRRAHAAPRGAVPVPRRPVREPPVGPWHRVWRPFSVANAPRADGLLTFHVRAAGGWEIRPGPSRQRGRPGEPGPSPGARDVRRDPARGYSASPAAGPGPLKALIEQAMAEATGRGRIRLVVGARHESELTICPTSGAQSYYPWLRISTAVSDDPDYTGVEGMLPDSSPASSAKR